MTLSLGASASLATDNDTSATTAAVTTQATGSCFVVFVGAYDAAESTPSLTDSKGNTYTLIGSYVENTGNTTFAGLYYCENGVGGTDHAFTLTLTGGSGSYASIYAVEVIGAATSGVLDGDALATSETSGDGPYVSGDITTTNANDMLLAFSFVDATTPSGSQTITANTLTLLGQIAVESTSYGIACATGIVSSVTTTQGSFSAATKGTYGITGIVALKAAAGSSGALDGDTSLTFTPTGTLTGAGVLGGATTLIFTPGGSLEGAGSMAGGSTLTFLTSGTLSSTGAGVLAGSTTLTFTTASTATATGALAGVTAMTFTSGGALIGAGVLAGTTSLTFTSTGTLMGGVGIDGATTLTCLTAGVLIGAGALVGESALTFTTTGTLGGGSTGVLAGTTSLTFTPLGALMGGAMLQGSSSLTFFLAGGLSQEVTIDGGTSLTFTVTGTMGSTTPSAFYPTFEAVYAARQNLLNAIYQAAQAGYALTVAGSGQQLGDQRNLPMVTAGNYASGWNDLTFTYTTTPTLATINVSAATLTMGNVTIDYGASSCIAGGSPGATGNYYLYYNDPTHAGGNLTAMITANIITAIQSDGYVLMGTLSITFPTSGSGGGGGGGNCVGTSAWVIRRAWWGGKRRVRAGTVRVGDALWLIDGRWGRVTFSAARWVPRVRLRLHDGTLTCSGSAPLKTVQGPLTNAAVAQGATIVARAGGVCTSRRILDVVDAGDGMVQHLTCENACFWAGDQKHIMLAHHNIKPGL